MAPAVARMIPWAVVSTLGLIALLRSAKTLLRILAPHGRWDGLDLRFRWREVQEWFAGRPVYGTLEHADYPPATQLLLWPFIGWLDVRHARWLWTASIAFMLVWLAFAVARESGLRSRLARVCVGLIPVASYATAATFVVGQMTIHVLASLVAGLMILTRGRTLRDDLLGSIAVVAALAKPSLSVPLVWVAVLVPGRLRPAVLIGGGYAALTLGAAHFQSGGVFALINGWLGQFGKVGSSKSAANLQALLEWTGIDGAFLPIALGIFVLTGGWVWRHRRIDVWVLIGVTALVARFWTYHREFDDAIALLPAVALLRLARFSRSGPRDWAAAALAGVLLAIQLAPYAEIRQLGMRSLFNLTLTVSLLAALGYLLFSAARQRRDLLGRASHPGPNAPEAEADDPPEAGAAFPPSAGGTRGLQWLSVCVALPTLVLAAAYAWLCVAHQTLWVWDEVVHESGRYTLTQTVFYFSHFLREIPALIAMALFTLAALGGASVQDPKAAPSRRGTYTAALLAAGALALLAFAIAAIQHGPGEALRHLLQEYTRDDVASFGSHWHYHWLSTLWFAFAAPLLVRLGALWGGVAPRSDRTRHRRSWVAAWFYFGGMSLVFGFSDAIAIDPLYIGHQAREIATHTLVTLPMALAIAAWIDRGHASVESGPRLTPGFQWRELAAVAAIAIYLGIATLADNVVAVGQGKGDLASMIAAHFFEHSLDYVFVGLLIGGSYGLSAARSVDLARPPKRAASQ